jgi:hypothetical protein
MVATVFKPGLKIGKLTVVERASDTGTDIHTTLWTLRCSCGETCTKTYMAAHKAYQRGLDNYNCGGEKHKPDYSKIYDKRLPAEYRALYALRKKHRVVSEWLSTDDDSLDNFIMAVGKKPKSAHGLYRVNRKEPYGPNNCKWLTSKEAGKCRVKNKTTIPTWSNPRQGVSVQFNTTGPVYMIAKCAGKITRFSISELGYKKAKKEAISVRKEWEDGILNTAEEEYLCY